MEYLVVWKGKSSYGAYVPDLPGCVAVGETRREVRSSYVKGWSCTLNLREAGEHSTAIQSKSEIVKVRAANNAFGGCDTLYFRRAASAPGHFAPSARSIVRWPAAQPRVLGPQSA